MDATRFDRWARSLAIARSRRGALRLLTASALAGLIGIEATAKKKGNGKGKGKKKGCRGTEKKCGNKCIAKDACCSNKDCDQCALEICQNGICGCHESKIRSNGVCGTFVNCLAAGEITSDAGLCCSDKSVKDPESGQERCLPGDFMCLTPVDCFGAPCRGFMCPGLYHSHAPNCS
jgi:hypothetical protein